MGAAAARKDEDTGIGPLESLQVRLELTLSQRMMQTLGVLAERPVESLLVDVSPTETIPAMRRIPEIINLMTSQAKLQNRFAN